MAQVNFSLNGIPGTLWEIRRQENVHPYLGLRQAILIIDSKEKALREARLSQKKLKLNIKKQRDSVQDLIDDALEISLAEIDIAEHEAKMFEQLILDAEVELTTALAEKERIEIANPDMASCTYRQLQDKYATEAFHNKLTKSLAVSIYSSYKMIPEGAGELVYDTACLSPTEREQFDTNTFQQLSHLLTTVPNPQLSNSVDGGSHGFIDN